MTDLLYSSIVPQDNKLDQYYFFDQTNNKFEHVSKVDQELLSTKGPLQLTEEYLINNSLNVLLNGSNKFSLEQVVKDYGLLSACEKNLIKNLAKKEDIHGVYYLLGVIYLTYQKNKLLEVIDWVNSYESQKQFKEEVIVPKVSNLINLSSFSDKEIALFYRFFTLISIETFESIGSRFNSLIKQNDILGNLAYESSIDPYINYSGIEQQQQQPQQQDLSPLSSPLSSPVPSSSPIDMQVFNNSSTVEVMNNQINYCFQAMLNYSSSISSSPSESSIHSTPIISSTSINMNVPSSPSSPSFDAQQFPPSSPSSPSYAQIAPSSPSSPSYAPSSPSLIQNTDYYTPTPVFESFPNVKIESISSIGNNLPLSAPLPLTSPLPIPSLVSNSLSPPLVSNSLLLSSLSAPPLSPSSPSFLSQSFSSQFAKHVQPKAARMTTPLLGNGKPKKVTKTKSIPKAVISPSYRNKLVDFGFQSQELDRPSHLGTNNYITSANGHSSIANTMLHPVPTEVSTNRIVRNGLILFVNDIEMFPKVIAQPSLYSKGSQFPTDSFEFKKNSFSQIEPGVYHFEFAIKRNEKSEKWVSIRLDLYSNNTHFDTIITPYIRFRNTPSEFSHPSENIIIKSQPYQPPNLPSDVDLSDYSANTFVCITNFFKKGIKATERNEGDGESIQKPGKPLVIHFKNNATNQVTKVYQDISKVPTQDIWKFAYDSAGNIINFVYSNVIQFQCIIQKGAYDISFLYDNVPREIPPQIKNYII